MYGLRGVGKTVLLNRLQLNAEAEGVACVPIEAPEDRSLPSILLPALRSSLIRLSRGEAAKNILHTAMGALAAFAKVFRMKYEDVDFYVDIEPVEGIADSGDLENDLAELLHVLGEAAQAKQTVMALFIDELQFVEEDQLSALIAAFHKASQAQLPITMFAAGLPQLLGRMGKAKSYAERLFEFTPLGPLDEVDAANAIVLPARGEGVEYESEAIDHIVTQTKGYPYFLQEWGRHSWRIAEKSPITLDNTVQATDEAIGQLDSSFFRVRFDRLTPSEKRYMRAMAALGEGPHRSGDIAELLNRKVTSVAPTRSSLIRKGMVFSPSHGDTAFTVPLFDGFMKRTMHLET